MIERILYTSFVDLGIPYGPGVNEIGFLKDMLRRYGDNLHALIPAPSREMPADLAKLNTTYLTMFGSSRKPPGWLQARTTGAFSLWRAMQKFKPDIIVMRSGALPIAQLIVPLLAKTPYVLKTAGDGSHAGFYRRHRIGKILQRFDQLLHRYIIVNAAFIDVVSEAHRNGLLSRYPETAERIRVIDNGVDAELFDPDNFPDSKQSLGFKSDDLVVGYIGSAPMRRGGREVIDAVAALKSKLPVRGLIVGDSGEAGICRDYARRHGVSDIVNVYGEADYAEVPGLMAALDCGLSIRRSGERGASELKVRQYLASAACVVGTAGSNDFLQHRDFARVVQSEDPAEITRAVESLLANENPGIAGLAEKARAFANRELTITARNERRLQCWAEQLATGQAAG